MPWTIICIYSNFVTGFVTVQLYILIELSRANIAFVLKYAWVHFDDLDGVR